MKKVIYGWHFLADDKKLKYGDERKVRTGTTYRVSFPSNGCDKPTLCCAGMHASVRAIDALGYAPGPIVCRVRVFGDISEGSDKVVAANRTVLWMADASNILFEMSAWAAERALLREREKGREPDARSWAAIQARRDWLKGKIAADELAAAWSAAESAAWSAAWSAAESAARSAAESAARSAARSAEKEIQNTHLTKLLTQLHRKK